ncbi:hypothetical protein BJY52DRAFT_1297672 [Lactarius psammicola]|nr:hypothetical protein BJY52DRAFT_1297672 [Lactarius psammicola]
MVRKPMATLLSFLSRSRSITSPATTRLMLNSSLRIPDASYIDALPEEIIVKILEWCDFRGVLACQRTCRTFRNVIEGSAGLRYKLALSKNGMCDEPGSQMTAAEKLELLTAHAAAWRSLHAVQPESATSLVGWSAPAAVSGNVLVFSRTCNGIGGEHGADAAAPGEVHLDLLVVRVLSPLRRIEGTQWMLCLPVSAGELCIDAAQDLLIYVLDHTLCVRTLSTGVVHPLVVGHEGSFKMWKGNLNRSFGVFNLSVCGDYVAAGTRIYFISVWNWKTGALVSDQISDVTFSSFDFLDEHHILYAVSSEDSIYVYDLRCGTDLSTKAEAGHRRFQLELPPIHRDTTSRYIQIRRNALPMRIQEEAQHGPHVGDGDGDGVPPSPPPFYADPLARLVVLRVVTSPVEFGEEQFELHVPARVLLEHFAAKKDAGGDAVLPWSAWCADTDATPVRRLPYIPQARMITYGMRAVSHPPNWDEGVLYLDSYPSRRASTVREGSGAGATGVVGTRQAIPLPDELPGKENFLSVLCEDALLCFKMDPSLSRISHAYWFTP